MENLSLFNQQEISEVTTTGMRKGTSLDVTNLVIGENGDLAIELKRK